MAEQIIVRQNSNYETEFLSLPQHDEQVHYFYPVQEMQQLTPYGMLLASLGSCTAVVLHSYAQHHGIDLQAVELHLIYDRVFREDCEHCVGIAEYQEQIDEEITLIGDLGPEMRQKLFAVSKHCPIHKMLSQGIKVESRLAQEIAEAT